MEQKTEKQSVIVGITGPSGAGKTFLLQKLSEELPSNLFTTMSFDNYYKPLSMQQRDAMGEINFDLPTGVDHILFQEHLQQLRSGKILRLKKYSFNKPSEEEYLTVNPAPIILMEGLFLFHFPLLKQQMQLKIYVDVPEEISYQRRLLRDQIERGMTAPQIAYQWQNHVKPGLQQYLYPYKNEADLIITNDDKYAEQIALLREKILSLNQ